MLFVASLFLLLTNLCTANREDVFTEEWRWIHFTTEFGLPSNHILAIAESHNRTIWAATTAGVAWYDGFQWRAIDSADGLPPREPSFIEPDLSDSMLIGIDGRLYRGNRTGFHRILIDGVQTALPVSQETIVILARDTLYLYQSGKLKVFRPFLEITHGKSVSLCRSESGTLLLLSIEGFYRWNGSTWKLINKTFRLGEGRSNAGYFIRENRQGIGIAAILNGREVWDLIPGRSPQKNIRESSAILKALDVGPDGEVITVNLANEARIRRGNQWSPLLSSIDRIRNITVFHFAANGDLWVGTINGLHLYRQSLKRWAYIKHPSPDPRNIINEIVRARDGSILLGTNAGIDFLAPDGRFITIDHIERQSVRGVTALAEDAGGNIWIGSGSVFKGAYCWNGTRWHYFKISDDPDGIFVHRIERDRHGRLWFLGLLDNDPQDGKQPGAFVLDDGRFVRWGKENGLLDNRVYAFAEGTDSALWFGTWGGITRWKNGVRRYWQDVRCFALAIDSKKQVWYSSRSSSSVHVIDADDNDHEFTANNGLIDAEVWNIKTDDRGAVWVATAGGLSCFSENTWSRFEYEDGLPNPFVWGLLPTHDRVYVGTGGSGLAILSLEELSSPSPRIVIDKPVIEDGRALVRWHVFPYWEEIRPENTFTRYSLDNASWSPWDKRREIIIADLFAGDHSIRVQAKGLFGKYDSLGQLATFTVAPLLYFRPAFALPIGILTLVVVFLCTTLVIRKRRHSAALRTSEAKFRRLTEAAFEGIAIHDKGIILDANPSILRMFGYSYPEFVGRSALDFTAPESREIITQNMLSENEEPYEAVGVQKNGSRIVLEIIGKLIPYEARTVGVIAIRDITARKQSEEQLLSYQERLKQLALELSMTEERERRRMASYLHDSVTQALGFSQMKLGELSEAKSQQEIKQLVGEVNGLIEQSIKNAQSLTFELSPPILYELGIEDAIEWLCEQMEHQHKLRIILANDHKPKSLSDEKKIVLFHAVRELLINVVKHARATTTRVSLLRDGACVRVIVEDDGQGFNPPIGFQSHTKGWGFGLFSIRERLTSVGGSLHIGSKPGEGTRITLEVPIILSP